LEKCKISMQDNAGKIGCAPKEKPTVKPFLADKLTKGRESFECCTFDHSDNSPRRINLGCISLFAVFPKVFVHFILTNILLKVNLRHMFSVLCLPKRCCIIKRERIFYKNRRQIKR